MTCLIRAWHHVSPEVTENTRVEPSLNYFAAAQCVGIQNSGRPCWKRTGCRPGPESPRKPQML